MHRLWRMRQRCNGGVSESWPVFNMGAKETFSAMGLKATFMNGNVSDVELSVRASELDRAGKRNEDSMTVQSFCKAAKYGSGLDTLDYGSLIVAKGTTAGYLPQDGLSLSGRTVFAECMAVFTELHAMERELESLT